MVTPRPPRGTEVGCRIFPPEGAMSKHQATSDVAKRPPGQVVCNLRIPSLQKNPHRLEPLSSISPFRELFLKASLERQCVRGRSGVRGTEGIGLLK